MSPLSITRRRLHACRSSVPVCIDAAATSCFSKTKKVDDDNDQSQTSTAAVRYYSCNPHITSPLNYFSSIENNITQTITINKRSYHTTSRNEILPFLAIGGILGITSVYTYRALEQMDNDWEEYYEKVEEYKLKTGIDPEKEYLTVTKQQIDVEKKKQEDR